MTATQVLYRFLKDALTPYEFNFFNRLLRGEPPRINYNTKNFYRLRYFRGIKSKTFGELAEVDLYTLVGAPNIEGWSEGKKKRLLLYHKVMVKLTCAKYVDTSKLVDRYKIIPFLLVKALMHLIPDKQRSGR